MSIPNYLTFFRILICPFFFTCLVSIEEGNESYRQIALVLFVIASLTDALDGALARLQGKITRLGQFLDPLADKCLLLSGFLGLLFVDALAYTPPLWITVTIVFRDVLILGGIICIYFITGTLRVQTNRLGKLTTVCQMFSLILLLLEWKAAVLMCHLTAALTIASCLVYLVREVRVLSEATD